MAYFTHSLASAIMFVVKYYYTFLTFYVNLNSDKLGYETL